MPQDTTLAPRLPSPPRLPLAFRDHARFHRTVGRGLLAGALAGGASALVASIVGPVSLFAPVVIGVAVAATFDAWWPFLLASAAGGGLAGIGAVLPGGGQTSALGALVVGGALGALAGRRRVLRGPRRAAPGSSRPWAARSPPRWAPSPSAA